MAGGCRAVCQAGPRGVVVTEAGSYLRRTDFCITQLEAQGPSRFCNESKEEVWPADVVLYAKRIRAISCARWALGEYTRREDGLSRKPRRVVYNQSCNVCEGDRLHDRQVSCCMPSGSEHGGSTRSSDFPPAHFEGFDIPDIISHDVFIDWF